MSKDKVKDKSKRRESKSGSESKKARKSASTSAIDALPITVADDAPSTSRTVTSAFERMYPVLNLPIPPVWSADPYSAFSDLMDTLVMRYVPQLSGVLITHTPTRFLQDTAVFSADSAFATAAVGLECVVWRPKIGQVLEGTICLSSPSHVSLLLYGLFNAAIPASHLPESEWEFVHDTEASQADHGLGFWRNRSDGAKLGGDKGRLSFTVISLTVANHMLSVHGSLLADPLNGPSPTSDRSYLKKSLLPSQALGLGTARSSAALGGAAARSSPAPTLPRRVRWEDEDDTSAVDSDDPSKYATPPSIVKSEPAPQSASTEKKKEKSKRKSTAGLADAADDAPATDSPKRDKKRRKEA
ncbi:related to Rpa43-43 kD subunit of DNA-directed RNA polymerase I [Sporisorium reilianum f. sp. reilianum]|uniref:Related to Rpa43-43 kD subunit of DNA-directed RNA polymerase I n=1 Tax=Sporisorium reilianum f. sp. reilianum TaxID=72559 RepID=A0A2N8U9J2_9BASI|nr:related to Rpa43-43 kD subunit of DNA-directed RNA polymerase I [Sporisorium reilianum f. sp. reilianum]